VNGGIEFRVGLLADRSRVLCEIAGSEVTFTSWATAHLRLPNGFAFSGRRVSYVFLVAITGLLSLNGLYHIFSKLKMTKYFGIKLMKPDAQKRADFRVKSG